MKKFWIIYPNGMDSEGVFVHYKTREEACNEAGRKTVKLRHNHYILELVGIVIIKDPIPDIHIDLPEN